MANKLLFAAAASLLAMPAATAFSPLRTGMSEYDPAFKGHAKSTRDKSAGFTHKDSGNGMMRSLGVAGGGIEQVTKYGDLTLLIEEDFSLLSTGTEEEPDTETILNYEWDDPEYQYVWNNMKPEFVHGNLKWGIGNAYPAGGSACFMFSASNPEAHIVTPMMDLTANDGSFVVEFRAKASADAEIFKLMVEASETRNWGPTWDEFDNSVEFTTISNEWTTYRAIFQKGGPTSLCNIYAEGMAGNLYVDDVKIYSLKPFVDTPTLKRHTDFTQTSFKANWEPVDGADRYFLSVWSINEEGEREFVLEDKEIAGATSCEVNGVSETTTYFYDVRAAKGEQMSLLPLPYEVFDIVSPEMMPAEQGSDERTFISRVKPLEAARGYNFYAMTERTAKTDGPFVITDEQFTGWKHPNIETEQPEWTIENPYDQVSSLWYPTDIRQQGWHGENFMTYKDFLCIDPFFWEAGGEQCGWISPEFDLSKDGGKISIDLKLAGKVCELFNEDGTPAGTVIADCLIALFNWNDEIGDYEQVESVRCSDVTTSWKPYHVELTKGSSRSVIGFFAVHSLDNLYVDDILIQQNYKAGEKFYDPFAYRTWLLADQIRGEGGDPERFEYTLPSHAWDRDIYHKAQAARIHFDKNNSHDGEALSGFSKTEYVGNFESGLSLVLDENDGSARVIDGTITILNPEGKDVMLFSADGKAALLGSSAEIRHKAPRGAYVVRIGTKSIKLVH